jgi:hypothetical protein
MPTAFVRKSALSTAALTFASLAFMSSVFCPRVQAQSGAADGSSPFFAPGNLVVLVEGCGVNAGTCSSIPGGNGTGGTGTNPGTSTTGGYGDNQAAPVTLFQYKPTGTASAQFVNSMVLPQASSGANLPVSGEYGSSSEGSLSLSGAGQYLVFGAYGINPVLFDANPTTFGAAPSLALAQSGSLTTQSTYTPVPRTVVLVDPNGNVNSSSAIYNVFNNNNPRSVYTLDGLNAWISGQGNSPDTTGGVFYTALGAVNNTPVSITGLDTVSGTPAVGYTQDTRNVQVYNGTLYVSVDSKEGSGNARSFIGTLGTPPATTLYNNNAGPTQLTESGSAGGSITSTSKITLTVPETNNVNYQASGSQLQVNLSPSGFYFAAPNVLYVADTGLGKQTAANSPLGDGGLQKWVNTKADGTGTWQFVYNLYLGLNLVANTSTSGTTGLYALTGTVSNGNVYLYATNYTIGDLDQRYLYGITDVLASTTQPTGAAATFTTLATAPADSNFKGVSFVPTYPANSATLTTVPSGLSITTAGAGCAPGTYVTPVTLVWTAGSACTLTTAANQTNGTVPEIFTKWQDNNTSTTDSVTTPAASATYTAFFVAPGPSTVTVASPSIVAGTASTTLTASIAYNGPTAPTAAMVSFQVNGSSTGVGATTCTGTASPITCTASFASSSLAVGTYPIRALAGNSYSNFSLIGNGTLTVTAATDFSFAVAGSGTSQTISKGGMAVFAFALAQPQGSYPGPVSFAVSGLPNGVTGVFSPSTLAANSGATTVTLTLTAASTIGAVSPSKTQIAYGSVAFFAAMLLPLCFRRRLRVGVLRSLTLVLFVAGSTAMVAGITGCSNNSAPKASTGYPFTVTATSGSVTHSTTETLVVNP